MCNIVLLYMSPPLERFLEFDQIDKQNKILSQKHLLNFQNSQQANFQNIQKLIFIGKISKTWFRLPIAVKLLFIT